MWCVLKLFVPGFGPTIPIAQPQWSADDNILNFSQKHHLYFWLQAKKNMFFSSHDQTNIFLWANAPSEYADVVTTIQTTVDAYRHPEDDGLLPEHLRLDSIAMMIHTNAKHWVWDINAPRIHRISGQDSPWDSVDSKELAYCHVQGYCPRIFRAEHSLDGRAGCSINTGLGSGQLRSGGAGYTRDSSHPVNTPNGRFTRPDQRGRPFKARDEAIRSRKQGDTDGTFNIVLPCPGS
jgi:hypothetical protein